MKLNFEERRPHQHTQAMVKQVKGGYLLRYKKRLFGKAWREEWVVLYEDSTLAWYKEKGRGEPEGSLVVKEAPEMLAVSEWTARIPGRPDLPQGCHLVQLMAFGTRRRDKVHWLLAQSEEEVNDWMTAISNTLPPPPQPPDEKGPKPLDPVTPRLPPVPYYPSVPGEAVPPPYHPAPPSGYNVYPGDVGGYRTLPHNNTTIVVRDGHMSNGIGDFTSGVMMGATLTNWGHGWGWGGGWGYHPSYNHDTTDIHISNHYDINNTTISNSSHYDGDSGGGGFDDADYGMDCGADFGI